MQAMRWCMFVGLVASCAAQMGGCPAQVAGGSLVIPGGTGDVRPIGGQASVQVLAPGDVDLAIAGGTPVEVVWRVVATTNFATVDVFLDLDQVPDNGNEIFIERGLAITEASRIADTTLLEAGSYFVGVALNERGVLAAFDYAGGRLLINQRPLLSFASPRGNVAFDRSPRIVPTIEVRWTVEDPDNRITTRIFLDPDSTPDGDEFLLRESDSQTGDSFSFDLPTSNLEAGTYRILAIVDDGVDQVAFYAPGTILLRSRLSGFLDLRPLGTEAAQIPGAIFEGFNPRDNAGSFVDGTGDVDADGFDDFIILAQFGKPRFLVNTSRTGVGEGYFVFGRSQRFTGRINLNSTGTLFRGNVYVGPAEAVDPIRPSRGITSFTVLSDWDADGLREFAFGMPFTDSIAQALPLDADGYFRSGCVVVAASSSLRPDLGFPGGSVIGLADIGTLAHQPIQLDPQCPEGFEGPKAPPAALGGGSTFYWRHLVDVVVTPNAGSIALGCRLSSNEFNDAFGESISAYQFDGLIMSAPNRDPLFGTLRNNALGVSIPGAGTIHIFFSGRIDGVYPWSAVQAPPTNPAVPAYLGLTEHIAEPLIPHGGPYHYIVDDYERYGPDGGPGYFADPDDAPQPCERVFGGSAVPNSANTVRIYGTAPSGRLGGARSAGDINDDGLEDILIGNPLANDGDGAVFIVLGRLRLLVAGGELGLDELTFPMNSAVGQTRIFDGIRIMGTERSRLGESQDRAGDFNNDGLQDVVIGSPQLNDRRGGAVVFFGSRDVINLTQEEIAFESIAERGLGVNFVGEEPEDLAGARVVGAGDVDGDRNDDILIAAPGRSVKVDLDQDGRIDVDRRNCGVVYLIYGSPKLRGTFSLSEVGTEQLPGAVFIGRNSGDFLGAGIGEQGDRSYGIASAGDVDGDRRADLLMSSVLASPRDRVRAGEVYLIYGQGE